MALMLVGLVCMCCMRLAWTEENVGLTTLESSTQSLREVSSVESAIGIILFQLLDKQVNKDMKVTLTEYFLLWSSADSNNDKYLSAQEVNTFLEHHLLGPSSNAERMFGGTDLSNHFSLKILFNYFDTNKDYILRSAEFYSAYMKMVNTS